MAADERDSSNRVTLEFTLLIFENLVTHEPTRAPAERENLLQEVADIRRTARRRHRTQRVSAVTLHPQRRHP
jgi:hypothetical protein